MQLNELKPNTPSKRSKRVGRGGKRGSFSGGGTKGQGARAGLRIRPALRDIIKKIPKLRGYRAKGVEKPLATVDVSTLSKHFVDNEVVTPASLLKKGLIRLKDGKTPPVKLLGSGTVARKLIVKDCQLSAGARGAIEKAGGSVAVSAPVPVK